MTNDKAVKLLRRIADEQFDGEHGDERREALEMAVRALEGDGDTISRQAAIDAVVSAMIDGADAELVEGIMEMLPSAQPERKTGKWIDGQCSNCGCDIPAYIIDWKWQKDMDANYCPNCGAKMEVEHETD